MTKQKIYASRNLSALYMLQVIAVSFFAAGLLLAFKLQAAPVSATAITSRGTHVAWSLGLAALAALAPVVTALYAHRVVAEIAVNQDGKTIFVKSSLYGAPTKAWQTSDLKLVDGTSGDAQGEQSLGLPRITLVARSQAASRRYVLAVKDAKQVRALKAMVQTWPTAM